MRPARRGATSAFTLIELLTVTGIVIVLAALMMTAAFSGQEAGRTTQCRSNLTQIYKLVLNYTTNYGGYVPSMWHERWIGELGLAGGRWRPGIKSLMQRKDVKDLTKWGDAYALTPEGRTDPPGSNALRTNITNQMWWEYEGNAALKIEKIDNPDDVNPLMPNCWNNYSPTSYYTGATAISWEGRPVYRSGAPFILCPSDVSAYRSDQGCLTSYMGQAKYGWWHRGGTTTEGRYFMYCQINEIPNPSRALLLSESEPGTWQYGGCG